MDAKVATKVGKRNWLYAVGILAAAMMAFLLSSPAAHAGTYSTWECHSGAPYGGDIGNAHGGQAIGNAYDSYNNCGSGGYFGVSNPGSSQWSGDYRGWDIFAPAGTRFTGGYVEYSAVGAGWHSPLLSVGNGSAHTATLAGNTGGPAVGINWSAPDSSTTQMTVWMVCSANPCGATGAWSQATNLVFNINDYTAPGVSIGGSLSSGGWRNSGGSLTSSGSDSGGGVEIMDHYINGAHVSRDTQSCSTTNLFGGTVGTRLTPCPTSTSMSRSHGTGSFQQGSNTYTACNYDFSGSGDRNGNCTSTTINIDTVAPESVSGMTVAGGEAWRPNNDFDLSWSNPGQAHAPIDGTMYRMTRVGGGYDSGAQFVSGSNRQSLNDLNVPSAGEYQLKVWARDSASNSSEANARTATLRFDPTVPPESEAEYNGWIRRNDFDYNARWDQVPAGGLGPSGLDGYAVRVTQDPATDPCVTDGHPAATCSSAEVNNDGVADTEMPVSAAQVSEGQWYVHVVPVTGAGVKASEVKHTAMPVDEGDPQTSISGVPDEWVNHDVTVGVSATDALSGMSGVAGPDPQPRTCLQVDSGGADCEPDADLTRVVSGEGEYQLRYFARDLAGNENSGGPDADHPTKMNNAANVATVAIDKSGPALAFASARSADDPSLITASASDALSGLADGVIELRLQGSNGSWFALETDASGNSLRAYVPDELDPGRYEFRASATDEAGNTSATSSRADGSTMIEYLPLKEAVNLTASLEGAKVDDGKGKGKGKCKRGRGGKGKCKRAAESVTIPYGEPIQLSGHLQTSSDAPLRGRELMVTERLAAGGAPRERTQSVVSDAGGAYALALEPGPSRTVTVHYEGDGRFRGAESAPVDAQVRSKVLGFRGPKTVHEKRSIRFTGRIGMRGVDVGSQGKRLELQYEKARGKWLTINSAQAGGSGKFRIGYALRSNYRVRTKVRFRVLVPKESGWPYAGVAHSKAESTVILP